MKITGVIEMLTKALEERGDVEVLLHSPSKGPMPILDYVLHIKDNPNYHPENAIVLSFIGG